MNKYGPPGAQAISAAFVGGQLVVTRDDNSTFVLPGLRIMRAGLVDRGDGTVYFTFPED